MRYFAILKDSLREALDSKVLYVMFGLSTLVIILVASLSFKPLAAEKTMEQFFFVGEEVEGEWHERPPVLTMILNGKKKDKINQKETALRFAEMYYYRLVKVEVVSGDADAPTSEYALTISRTIPGKAQKEQMFALLAELAPDVPGKREQIVRDIFSEAETSEYIKLESVAPVAVEDAAKETARFRAVVKGTSKTRRIWVTEPAWLFGALPLKGLTGPLGIQMFGLAYFVISIGSWVTILVGIVITSFFFPNMLRKGTVDLLLVKPVPRWALLLYKYIGGLTFIFLSTSYAIVGIWLVLGIRSGLWATGSLVLILTLTFFFSILYAISTFVGVLTRSTVTAIMLTIAAYAFLGISGFANSFYEAKVKEEETEKDTQKLRKLMKGKNAKMVKEKEAPDPDETRWADSYWTKGSRALQKVSPRTEDLNQLNTLILLTDFTTGNLTDMSQFDTTERNWWESLVVCLIWIAIFLGLSTLWFTYKDY